MGKHGTTSSTPNQTSSSTISTNYGTKGGK